MRFLVTAVTNARVSRLVATNAALAVVGAETGVTHQGVLSDILLVCQIAVAVLTVCVIITKLIDWHERHQLNKAARPKPGEIVEEED